jgi:hypothetical protein
MSVASVSISKAPAMNDSSSMRDKLICLMRKTIAIAETLLMNFADLVGTTIGIGLIAGAIVVPFIALEGGISLLTKAAFSWTDVAGLALATAAIKMIY